MPHKIMFFVTFFKEMQQSQRGNLLVKTMTLFSCEVWTGFKAKLRDQMFNASLVLICDGGNMIFYAPDQLLCVCDTPWTHPTTHTHTHTHTHVSQTALSHRSVWVL